MPPAPDKPASAAAYDALPAGIRFGELEVLRVLGVGGFGIVYLARDHALERDVALKEYMPASLASRGEGVQVSVRSGGLSETYAMGLRSFVNEARLLAKFDHPSLVKVYRFWEANGTAYMVMPFLQGRTLRDARKAMGGKAPDETWLRGVLDPILGALEVLHREGVFHRDIAPDNIWLQNDGPPILLDFGAARRVITDRTQSLTAILKPSYAPIEQYAEMHALRQGPWTDLYALGAVTHFLLAGAPPGPSTARALQDEMVPLWMRHFPGVSPRFLAAIDWALQVRPRERPQSVQELRDALDGRIEPPAVERHDMVSTTSAPAPLADTQTQFEPTRRASGPGVSTSFEPTMRVAPSALGAKPTQAPARPAAAPVPAAPPAAAPARPAPEPATLLASVAPSRVAPATAASAAVAPRTRRPRRRPRQAWPPAPSC
ncbi:MAG: serine/threonine protein kinase [Piscinibacter sp.]|uniref:serine/threonine protein kinase n=1 Tax=Piscinibacter sp. TaxID=1903157 RepID=UPI002587B43D|nr:serine/threonine-protein kinase [Piscinibacter sp.]MCW5662716.1 serine/threonine protein kinase [Piscinibacter sp.]